MRKSRSTRAIATTGFTLIELILVVAILAIFTAVALPRFGNSAQRFRVDISARKIAADIAWCKQAARTTGQPAIITFSTTNNTYTLSGGVSTTGNVAPDLTVDFKKSPYTATLSAVSLTLLNTATATQSITFDANGIPSATGTITLSTATSGRVITISSPGGAVVITPTEVRQP